jgi:toxin HigB-1
MIKSFRSRAMERAFNGDVRRVRPNLAERIEDVLAALDEAQSLAALEKLTGFHALRGNRAGTYSVTVTRNWRITFTTGMETVTAPETNEQREEFHVYDVDFEDYH